MKIYKNSKLTVRVNGKDIKTIEPIKSVIGETTVTLIFYADDEGIKFTDLKRKKIKRAIFHLFEFEPLIGKAFKIESGEWIIKGSPVPDKQGVLNQLSERSWRTFSHEVEIVKQDKGEFKIEELEKCLETLSFIFSFSKGAACKPAFAVGYDKNNKIAWESTYSTPKPATSFKRWHGSKITKQKIESLFNGMMKKAMNDSWNSALHEAVNWYAIACSANSDRETKIALTQAAFERLSYEFAIIDKKLMSREAFGRNKLEAVEKLRILFASLNIPVDMIYDELSNMEGMEKKPPFDVPAIITQARNSIMHSKPKMREDIGEGYSIISELSVMYLELTILALCGYDGKYYNRLSEKMEEVPWKEKGKADRQKNADDMNKKIGSEKDAENRKAKAKTAI